MQRDHTVYITRSTSHGLHHAVYITRSPGHAAAGAVLPVRQLLDLVDPLGLDPVQTAPARQAHVEQALGEPDPQPGPLPAGQEQHAHPTRRDLQKPCGQEEDLEMTQIPVDHKETSCRPQGDFM
ncbi:hypothetical protein EYF80_056293 [Liparis tanakae]|uniref:Uncharacterized protein n=1 Tax=Liparis tanakae TaxID=230148 RepID=A0A4Z2EXJ8_9TELE|nr:hypothetical protein EYF80_056293 [Liparis tanakae]